MTLRERFESWQIDTGRTDPVWLVFLDGRYCLNDVQRDWEMFQEIAAVVVAECAGIARHYAFALDYRGNEYVRSRECQQAEGAMTALLERGA